MRSRVAWVGLGSLVAALLLYLGGAFIWLERTVETFQFKYNRNDAQVMPEDIVIVPISDETLEWGNEVWGRWPWQRLAQSQVLELLQTELGSPRLIAYDIPFAYPDLRRKDEHNEDGAESDSDFTQMMASLPTASLSLTFKNRGSTSAAVAESIRRFGIEPNGAIAPPIYTAVVAPMKKLSDAVTNLGHRNFIPESDGIVRTVPLFIEFQDRWYPSLSLVALCNWLGVEVGDLQIAVGEVVVPRPGAPLRIPIDGAGRCQINYFGSYYGSSHSTRSFESYYRLRDFKDPASIFFLLRETHSPAMVNLRSQLSAALRTQIYRWQLETAPSQQLLQQLMAELNSLIAAGAALYIEGSYDKSDLSSEALRWLAQPHSSESRQRLAHHYIQELFQFYLKESAYRIIDWSSLCQVVINSLETGGITSAEDRQLLRSLDDKVVLFTITAAGIIDFNATPFGDKEPTIALTANALNMMIAEDFLHRDPRWRIAAGLLIVGLLAVVTMLRWGTLVATLSTALVVTVVTLLARHLFYAESYYLEVVALTLPTLVGFVAITLTRYYIKQRERAEVKAAFGKYVSGDVVAEILDDPSKCALGGHEKELTIFFSDLSGFTTISEKFKDNPAELVALLNHYLNSMSQLIQAEGGTVDRYEGDAIFAFFNAPLDMPDHRLRACRAALSCQRELDRLRAQWLSEGLPDVKARIGLNTGVVTVGNMGARDKMSYTIHGDHSHYAERLEQESKTWGTRLLINQRTWEGVQGHFCTREVDRFPELDGGVASFYELISEADTMPEEYSTFVPLWNDALQAYREQQWQRAIELFSAAEAEAFAGELGCALYRQRCEELMAQPPQGDSWDGCVREDSH